MQSLELSPFQKEKTEVFDKTKKTDSEEAGATNYKKILSGEQ